MNPALKLTSTQVMIYLFSPKYRACKVHMRSYNYKEIYVFKDPVVVSRTMNICFHVVVFILYFIAFCFGACSLVIFLYFY